MTRKLRPYDEPPRHRRSLIPNAPDSAALGFLVVAALWLVAATGIGVLAFGERLFPDLLKFSFSIPVLGGIGVEVNQATADPAFVDALVFGWLTNVALSAILFVTPRLTGRRLNSDALGFMGLGAWNLAVAAGIVLLYVKGASGVGPLAEFPLPVKGLALLGLLAVNGAFWRTVLPTRAIGYVSLLYFGIGLLALVGLFALATIPGVYSLGTTNDRLLWAFTARGIVTYWVLGTALGTLYYVIPRVTRNPLASGGLALIAFLGWLAFAGLSAIGALVDPSVPYLVTTLGQAGTLLLLAPVFLAVANLVGTIRGSWSLLLSPGTLQFAVTALAFLIATALLESVGALRSVQTLTAGTDWALGVSLLGLLGSATFAFYAFADHALPRILRRGFGGAMLAQAQLWTSFIGVLLASLAMIGGALIQGSLQSQGASAQDVSGALFGIRVLAAGGLGLVSLAGMALIVNLFLLYTEGRPVDAALVTGEPLAAGQ